MENFSPIVITSKAATEDLNKIKAEHATIVQGIQDQSVRVSQYNSEQAVNKQAEDQQKQIEQKDNQKAQMDMESKRIDAENKKRELDIKQQALMST